MVARSFTNAPGLIVASPFLRAQATAQVTAARYPAVAFETWPIQEYTYLAPARCVDTTLAQRRGWVEAYWQRADPAYRDGEGAESFQELVGRARSFLHRLGKHPATDIAVFSHGQLINTVAWLLEHEPQEIDGLAMQDWREYEIANHIENGQGFSLPGSRANGELANERAPPKAFCVSSVHQTRRTMPISCRMHQPSC